MIPIKDTVRAHTFPIVNWVLIIANVLIFLFETTLDPRELELFIDSFGLVPAYVEVANPLTWYPIFSHMFLHGGWFHLLSNVWILFIFGDNVEDRLGSGGFLFFYLLGGVAAGLLQSVLSPNPLIPSIGASGAIAAVMGAYIRFFPRSEVITFIPIFIFPWFINVPAILYLGFWFVSQLFSGILALANPNTVEWGGVAWWAHIGGFLFGLLVAILLSPRRRQQRVWYPDEYYPW